MSAQDNLSGQQFKVHRGLSEDVPMQWLKAPSVSNRTGGLGMHWSTSLGAAKRFAKPEEGEKGGTIIHGEIAKGDTYTPYSEEWHKIAYPLGIEGPSDWEREVTAKPHAPVTVTAVTHVRPRGPRGGLKARTIRVNPPRKMKA